MRAVDVEPVLADKVGLVEQCAVGAEEAVLGKPAVAIGGAHVESLALSFGVRVVTPVHLKDIINVNSVFSKEVKYYHKKRYFPPGPPILP